jgi:hypothetical protein
VLYLSVVSFCVVRVIRVLCLTVVPLSPGKNSFAVKINNNKSNNIDPICLSFTFNFLLLSFSPLSNYTD